MTNAAPSARAEIDALADKIAEVSAHASVLEHERLTYLRRFDELGGWAVQGAQSCAHWLSWRIGLSAPAAREQVRVARALSALPAVNAALGRGELSYSKVRALTRVASPENEALLVGMARHATAAQLERICRRYQAVAKGSGDEELARPHERRSFERRDLDSGLVRFTIQVRPEEASVVLKAVESAIAATCSARAEDASAEAPHRASAPEGASAEAPRRVDAFVAVCQMFLASPEARALPPPHEVQVHVDAASLEGELEDGAPLSPESVRRLLCDTPVVTLVEREGEPVAVGHRRRTIPASMRRALARRDGGCRFPGCTNRIWVDGHHVRHWAAGGETKLDNLVLLCGHHHRCVHEGGFELRFEGGEVHVFNQHGVAVTAPVPRLPDDVSDQLMIDRAELGIGPTTGDSLWDGTPVDYGAAVGALCETGSRLRTSSIFEEGGGME